MKIGKDEISMLGITGLILLLPGATFTFYGLISNLIVFLVGFPLLIIGVGLYYHDLYSNRKQRKKL